MDNLAQQHRYFGVECNNRTWVLLANTNRTTDETEEMIHCAHASFWHWSQFPDHSPANLQRGEFMMAMAYTFAKAPRPALYFAQACYNRTQRFLSDMKDFDKAYANAILFKALQLNQQPEAETYRQTALTLGAAIQAPEDKAIFDKDWAHYFDN